MEGISLSFRREVIIFGIIFLCFVVGWIVIDNVSYFGYFYGKPAEATTNTIALTLTVSETLTFSVTSGSTIPFGSVSGDSIQRAHETSFSIDTNSADGYRVDAGRDRTAATLVSDGNTTISISDTGAAGPDPLTGIPSCGASVWPSAGSSRGLGISMFSALDSAGADKKDSCFGTGGKTTSTANKYGALNTSVSATKIVRNTAFDSGTQRFSVGYILEFRTTQQATNYNGDVIYTGVATP